MTGSMLRSLLLLTWGLADSFILTPPQAPYVMQQPVPPRSTRAAVHAALKDQLRAVGAVALTSAVLLASPMAAHAKGGGHGGGGHSSSHSSHSSSYRSHSSSPSSSSYRRTLHSYSSSRSPRRSSSRHRGSSRRSSSSGYSPVRTYSRSVPKQTELYPDTSAVRLENGYYCPSLPKPGERVDVLGEVERGGGIVTERRPAKVISSQQTSQASLYGPEGARARVEPVPGFESDCSVSVQYDDGTTATVSAAEQSTPLSDNLATVFGLALAAGGALVSGGDDGEGEWTWAEERQEELLGELAATGSPPVSTQQPPPSGEYWGASEESDEGDQAVRSTITFHPDGSITGRGVDGVDGAYRIVKGRWGMLEGDVAPTVAWTEQYDEGFDVVIVGRFYEQSGRIEASFTSSRGVGGTFALAPKPSVF